MTIATATRLRPDVARVVALHAIKAPLRGGEREDWRAYLAFTAELCRTCGWDARPIFYDAVQYAAAVAAYLERVGL